MDARQKVYSNAFRARRLKLFLALADRIIERKGGCRVLDIGGEYAYWQGLRDVWGDRNLRVTLVNIAEDEPVQDPRFERITGDARRLDGFEDMSFDVVHSNSVIEHVGGWADMRSMADEVRRLAPAYFVQTPNFWFPQEPHLRVPGIHWLPHPLQRRIVMARACGFYPRARDIEAAYRILSDASLLDAAGMASLFPDARITRERFGPLTKSLIAIRP